MTSLVHSVEQIGPYRILNEIGRGGMGVVYRALSDSGEEVALKIPSRDLSHLFGWIRREIHALGRLRHPGVVRILNTGIDRGVPWYAMELLHGDSLERVLTLDENDTEKTAAWVRGRGSASSRTPSAGPRVRTDLGRALTLMCRLARVLAYIHARGVVHRDLKPQNVFVQSGDRPVLVDFGLVAHFHALTSREVLEVSGIPTGTPTYLAPEQARGELVDARADLYSFGVMLYEIITGRPPFEGGMYEVLKMHINDQPVRPSELVRDVPPVLERLTLQLLEKNRSARLGYAEDVAEALIEAGAAVDAETKVETIPYLYRPEIVGRRETIDEANTLISRTRSGRGAFLLLGGVSGIGKTSVAAVLAREATVRQLRVVAGESLPVGGAPLHPFRPLFREIADQCYGHPEVLQRVLGPRLTVLRDLEPSLAALDESSQPIAPEIAARRLFSDLAETLAAFARESPLLLILDDLQWADEVTLRFLASLDPSLFVDAPLVILGTFRADEAGSELRALMGNPHVQTLHLGRLDDGSVGEIVRSMLATPDPPASFLQFLAAQTEGNPFFVAEYLRSAVAERMLFRDNGRWHVAASNENYAGLALPGTIRDLVAHRLARLSPLARRAAEAASVLGRECAEDQFVAVSGETPGDALDAIAELVEQQIVESSEVGIRFAHDKLRESAYSNIDESRRSELHRRAVAAIERSFDTDETLRGHEAELARHCDLAGLREKAIDYYVRAAETSVGTGACREAIDLMNRAIALDDLAESDRDTRTRRERRAHWRRVLSFAHFGLGDLAGSSEHARTSLADLGIHLPETARRWQLRLAAEAVRQSAHFLMPRRLVRSSGTQTVLRDVAMAAQKFSEARYYTDEKTVMLTSGLLAVNSAERLGDDAGLIHTYANFGAVTSGHGLSRIARRYYEKARKLAQATGNLSGLGHIGYTSAVLYITTCDWKSCTRYFDEAVAAAMTSGDHQLIEMNLMARGFFQLYRGRIAAASDTFSTVRDRAHKRLNRQHEAWGHTWRAGSLFLMNRGPEALHSLDAALELLAPLGDNAKLSSLALRCQVLLHMGRMDEALEAADLTAAAVAKIPAIIWEKYRGLSAPAEVYLGAWEKHREDAGRVAHLQDAIDVLLRRLEPVSRRMPLAQPVTLRLMGVRECLLGNTKRGERLLRRSIAAAVRLGLPVEEGIAQYELARWCAFGAERRALGAHAREVLENAGCRLYIEKLRNEGA